MLMALKLSGLLKLGYLLLALMIVQFRFVPFTENTIEISGNPAKWLQGHNLFGSNDLRLLMWVFFNRLIEFYDIGLNPTIQDLERIKEGRYTVSRVDINETWLLKIVLM